MKYVPSIRLSTIVLVGLCTATFLQATAIYTWEDDKGVIHFSDQPRPGASTVDLPSLPATAPQHDNTEPANTLPITDTTAPQDTQLTTPATIHLLSPLDQQTLRDNEGTMNISVTTNRKLDKGHNVQLLLDGILYGQPQTQLNWQLLNIDRGSHTLQAQILKYGKVIASSEVITVYLHRASLLQRKPPAVKPE